MLLIVDAIAYRCSSNAGLRRELPYAVTGSRVVSGKLTDEATLEDEFPGSCKYAAVSRPGMLIAPHLALFHRVPGH